MIAPELRIVERMKPLTEAHFVLASPTLCAASAFKKSSSLSAPVAFITRLTASSHRLRWIVPAGAVPTWLAPLCSASLAAISAASFGDDTLYWPGLGRATPADC